MLFASTSDTFTHPFSPEPISFTCPLFPSSTYEGSCVKFSCAGAAFFFRWKTKNKPAARASTTNAAPTPIPALAPEDSPPDVEGTVEAAVDEVDAAFVLVVAVAPSVAKPIDECDVDEAVEVDSLAVEVDDVGVVSLTILESNRSLDATTIPPSST